MRPGSAKPGNVRTNWTGTTSFQADYCHSSSGNGSSTGVRLCLAHDEECSPSVGGLQCPLDGAFSGVSQRTGTHFSHHCQTFRGSPHIRSLENPLTEQPVFQTSGQFRGDVCVFCVHLSESW